jgi:hypothetical protein
MGSGPNLLGAGQQGLDAYGQLYGMAGQDPTKANIAAAGQYADNPYLDGQIDAASRDVTRNLYENQLPGLNEAATDSGNMNSSRAGVAEGIMKRGAADQIGDIRLEYARPSLSVGPRPRRERPHRQHGRSRPTRAPASASHSARASALSAKATA